MYGHPEAIIWLVPQNRHLKWVFLHWRVFPTAPGPAGPARE